MSQKEISNYLPILLNITDQHILIVGGGKVAQRKLQVLLNYNVYITLICPEISQQLKEIESNNKSKIDIIQDYFNDSYLDNKQYKIIYAATDNEKLNQHIAQLAKEKHILANIATSENDSSFIMPAIIKENQLQIAISTSANSPLLAKQIKNDISKNYLPDITRFTPILGEIRSFIKQAIPDDIEKRQKIYDIVINSADLLNKISNNQTTIEDSITEIIKNTDNKHT